MNGLSRSLLMIVKNSQHNKFKYVFMILSFWIHAIRANQTNPCRRQKQWTRRTHLYHVLKIHNKEEYVGKRFTIAAIIIIMALISSYKMIWRKQKVVVFLEVLSHFFLMADFTNTRLAYSAMVTAHHLCDATLSSSVLASSVWA